MDINETFYHARIIYSKLLKGSALPFPIFDVESLRASFKEVCVFTFDAEGFDCYSDDWYSILKVMYWIGLNSTNKI